MTRIGVISDTHGHFDDRIAEHFKECDQIWHAGDIGSLDVMDALKKVAPVKGVYGNIDNHEVRAEYPRDCRFVVEGMDVWITHIGGKPYVYNKFTRDEMRRNPPDIFVCGHSHILLVQYDKRAKTLCLNPGAAGVKGFHKVRTLLRFTLNNRKVSDMEVVELGSRSSAIDQEI